MVGDYFGYGLSALTAIGAIVFGLKQASGADRTGLAARLKDVEDRLDDSDGRVQMLERREVIHERREGILLDTLGKEGIQIPALPPFPEAWSA